MTAVAIPKHKTDNVIELLVVDGKLSKKQKVRYNKDGSIDKRHNNKKAGVSSEVYPFTTQEEINAMISVFDKHIEEATNENQRQSACRNKMLFIIGMNVGLRASDLCNLTFGFFMENDRTFKNTDEEPLKVQPKKTRKTGKFVEIHINDAVKEAIKNYIKEYPIQDINEYLFKSRKGNKHITEDRLSTIIKEASKEAGIKKNIGSHSLRKTFGYWAWHNAEDKNEALIRLQAIFNHGTPQTTMTYIGLFHSDIKDVFNSINLGLNK